MRGFRGTSWGEFSGVGAKEERGEMERYSYQSLNVRGEEEKGLRDGKRD